MSSRSIPGIGRYQITRSRRRTLAISVLPDCRVEVVAPMKAAVPAIEAKLTKRAGWIARQRRIFAAFHADRPKPRFCSGATHRYLGRQYRLKVTAAKRTSVKLIGGYFHITSRSTAPSAVAALLKRWYRERATHQFCRRIEPWRGWCASKGLPEPRVLLRAMPKRWGSAHATGTILLNPELVRAPSSCIDYVIIHEICHLKRPRHDRAFFKILQQLCPRWQKAKLRLETLNW
ncbi:MAG: SprT family zinc-dependent metalloprotease [bacterium]